MDFVSFIQYHLRIHVTRHRRMFWRDVGRLVAATQTIKLIVELLNALFLP